MNISNAARATAIQVKKQISHLKKEQMAVIEQSGDIFMRKKGRKCVKLSCTEKLDIQIKNSGKRNVLVHNHAKSRPLSLTDILTGIQARFAEVQAFCLKGKTHLVEIPEKISRETEIKALNLVGKYKKMMEKFDDLPDTSFYRNRNKEFEQEIPGLKFRTII